MSDLWVLSRELGDLVSLLPVSSVLHQQGRLTSKSYSIRESISRGNCEKSAGQMRRRFSYLVEELL